MLETYTPNVFQQINGSPDLEFLDQFETPRINPDKILFEIKTKYYAALGFTSILIDGDLRKFTKESIANNYDASHTTTVWLHSTPYQYVEKTLREVRGGDVTKGESSVVKTFKGLEEPHTGPENFPSCELRYSFHRGDRTRHQDVIDDGFDISFGVLCGKEVVFTAYYNSKGKLDRATVLFDDLSHVFKLVQDVDQEIRHYNNEDALQRSLGFILKQALKERNEKTPTFAHIFFDGERFGFRLNRATRIDREAKAPNSNGLIPVSNRRPYSDYQRKREMVLQDIDGYFNLQMYQLDDEGKRISGKPDIWGVIPRQISFSDKAKAFLRGRYYVSPETVGVYLPPAGFGIPDLGAKLDTTAVL